jgi:superfamily II DNA or RNA helicase
MITPEKDLMHNAARRYELRTGDQAGRIGDGLWKPNDVFTAATFQTLAAELRKGSKRCRAFLDGVGGIIIDEVHTLPADTFYSVAQSIPAYWRIGMSGTPLARGDKKSLFSIASTGSIIYELKPQYLIDRGWLSLPDIRMVAVRQTGSPGIKTYRKAYSELVVGSAQRNKVLAGIAVQAAKPGLLFVREKKHGHALVKALRAAGLRTEFVWGEKSTAQRDQAIKALEWGDLDVIICSKVFVTGTDIPSLASIINGMGGKSEIETLQRLGRGMRVTDTKSKFEMWDVKDDGPVAGPNRWNAKHSNERMRAYAEQGYKVTVLKDFVP